MKYSIKRCSCFLLGIFTVYASFGQAIQVKKKSTPSTVETPLNGSLGNTTSKFSQPVTISSDTLPPTTVEWKEEVYDFGEIEQGTRVSHTFRFTNTGEHPLKLSNVKPSCGCTTPNWTKDIIQPGEEGFVEVIFDSAGKLGSQMKSITLFLNTTELRKVLRFKGYIIEKKS